MLAMTIVDIFYVGSGYAALGRMGNKKEMLQT